MREHAVGEAKAVQLTLMMSINAFTAESTALTADVLTAASLCARAGAASARAAASQPGTDLHVHAPLIKTASSTYTSPVHSALLLSCQRLSVS